MKKSAHTHTKKNVFQRGTTRPPQRAQHRGDGFFRLAVHGDDPDAVLQLPEMELLGAKGRRPAFLGLRPAACLSYREEGKEGEGGGGAHTNWAKT